MALEEMGGIHAPMKSPLPPDAQPTNEMLTLIAAIDKFKGEWRGLGDVGPKILRSLRRIATIESAGSSCHRPGREHAACSAKLPDRGRLGIQVGFDLLVAVDRLGLCFCCWIHGVGVARVA